MLISRAGVSLTIWLGVFTVVTSAILGLRFLAIKVQKRPYRPDDFMVVFAWINTTCLACLCWWAIANGLGAHTVELDPYELGVQYKLLLASGVLWLLGTVFCKLSILWLYTVIFTTKIFKWAAWFMMGIVGGYGVSFLCVFLTNCHPISFPWHPVPGGGCRELAVEELTSVSVNMLIDTLIVLLPMRSLWGLQMAARNKIAISFLFSLGFLVVGLMAWRIQITNQALTQTDFVFGLGNIALVSFLELWVGMIIVCVPTLAPLFAKYIKPAVSRISGSSKKSRSQPREAENTIGGGRSYKRKSYGKLGRDNSMELEEGKNLSHASATSTFEEDEVWINEPNAIAVRHDIHVYKVPQSPQR